MAVIAGVGILMTSTGEIVGDPAWQQAAETSAVSAEPVPVPVPGRAAPPSSKAEPSVPPAKPQRAPGDPRGTDDAMAGLDVRGASKAELIGMGLPEKLAGGVIVTDVDPRSAAAEAQLVAGDVIVEAHTTKVTSLSELDEVVQSRQQTMLKVYRGGKPFQVMLHRPFE